MTGHPEKLDRLIEILLNERGEKLECYHKTDKADLFRALCNIRLPGEVSTEFLELQDEYLSDKTKERGIVDIGDFPYRNGIALWHGDITRLNADAIVNAGNPDLLGCFRPLHNCIDNIIHSNAGVQVRLDLNNMLKGLSEPNGIVKVTKSYNLPSRFIFHTVGPTVIGIVTEQNKFDLTHCYLSCLEKATEMGLYSIAFPCISTGLYAFPKKKAALIAVKSVLGWQKRQRRTIKIIFDVFTDEDRSIYDKLL